MCVSIYIKIVDLQQNTLRNLAYVDHILKFVRKKKIFLNIFIDIFLFYIKKSR